MFHNLLRTPKYWHWNAEHTVKGRKHSRSRSTILLFSCPLNISRCFLAGLRGRSQDSPYLCTSVFFGVLCPCLCTSSSFGVRRFFCRGARWVRESAQHTNIRPKEVIMDFWLPIGDSPFRNWSPEGHQSVTKNSLAMLIPLLSLPFCFELSGRERVCFRECLSVPQQQNQIRWMSVIYRTIRIRW